jgi:hypothetical protein
MPSQPPDPLQASSAEGKSNWSLVRARLPEWLRPWKLATLAAGIGLLIVGGRYYKAIDWDTPVSVIMALVAYATAPYCMRVLLERRWRAMPLALFLAWFGVDGCYSIYWHYANPVALEMMRSASAPASLALFCTVGLLWMPRMSLRDMGRRLDGLDD